MPKDNEPDLTVLMARWQDASAEVLEQRRILAVARTAETTARNAVHHAEKAEQEAWLAMERFRQQHRLEVKPVLSERAS